MFHQIIRVSKTNKSLFNLSQTKQMNQFICHREYFSKLIEWKIWRCRFALRFKLPAIRQKLPSSVIMIQLVMIVYRNSVRNRLNWASIIKNAKNGNWQKSFCKNPRNPLFEFIEQKMPFWQLTKRVLVTTCLPRISEMLMKFSLIFTTFNRFFVFTKLSATFSGSFYLFKRKNF